VAARGACTTAGDAGDRLPRRRLARVYVERLRAFHKGLKEAGHVEGDNITVLPLR
jgi:hypothetical protein